MVVEVVVVAMFVIGRIKIYYSSKLKDPSERGKICPRITHRKPLSQTFTEPKTMQTGDLSHLFEYL